jgi:hypothetical protein
MIRTSGEAMSPILKKLMFKVQNPVLLVNAPTDFQKTAKDFGVPVVEKPCNHSFALGFVKSLAEAIQLARMMRRGLDDQSVFWMAYLKRTSKACKDVDIQRDTGSTHVSTHGFQRASTVSIDEDWVAIRFKWTD